MADLSKVKQGDVVIVLDPWKRGDAHPSTEGIVEKVAPKTIHVRYHGKVEVFHRKTGRKESVYSTCRIITREEQRHSEAMAVVNDHNLHIRDPNDDLCRHRARS